jgi:hypothetical protein
MASSNPTEQLVENDYVEDLQISGESLEETETFTFVPDEAGDPFGELGGDDVFSPPTLDQQMGAIEIPDVDEVQSLETTGIEDIPPVVIEHDPDVSEEPSETAEETIEEAAESMTVEQIAVAAQENTMASKLTRRSFSVSKKLTSDQVEKVAQSFGAEVELVNAAKKLIDTKHPKFKAIKKVMSAAYATWKYYTVQYPEDGVRLIRKDRIESFESEMTEHCSDLETAKSELDGAYSEIIEQAEVKLGELFNSADYPRSISAEFSIDWEYPTITPPDYLKNTHPELYERQARIIASRFEQAIVDTEAMLATEFSEMINHLTDKLGKDEETGEFRTIDSRNITKVTAFVKRFQETSFGGNETMANLVEQAKSLVDGVTVKDVRGDADMRLTLQGSMATLRDQMESLIQGGSRQITVEDDE